MLRAALAGVVAGGVAVGVGELAAVVSGPGSAPFLAIGNTFVDLTPEWLKGFAIRTFGENDKIVLLLGMGVVMALGAAVAGVLQWRRPPLGVVLLGLAGVVAVVAALTRPAAGVLDALPSVVGIAAGAVVLHLLVRQLSPHSALSSSSSASAETPAETPAEAPAETPVETPAEERMRRRRFLMLTVAAAAVGGLAAFGGQRLGAAAQNIREARDAVRLPRPARAAPALPDGVMADVDGITVFQTPNAEFYRVDTALSVPKVLPEEWSLRVHGMVDEPFELSFDDVLELDLVERMITLTCVSNEVGGDLAGNAVWLGYPMKELLERAGLHDDADMLFSTSIDGFTTGTPLAALTDGRDALLAIGMNGEPLPLEHGFPVRVVVPGLYGYVSATKWVVDMEVTRFDQASAYWTDRGWAAEAPIKTASRIDVPGSFAQLEAGPNVVAGTAWAQQRGITAVELRVDDGDWVAADLAAEASIDIWRQWTWQWDAEPGRHTLFVRATDGEGEVQTDETAPPFPEGSSGWHSVAVEVT